MPQDTFWTMVGAIAQVTGSVATFFAVYVALRLAKEERRIRLRVRAGLRVIINQDLRIEVVTISVENIGHREARIESLGWSTGFIQRWIPLPTFLKLQGAFQLDDYEWAINPRFPWDLKPGSSKSTHFRRASFFSEFEQAADNDLFRRLPFFQRWTLLNFRVGVGVTTLSQLYFGDVESTLREELEAGYEGNRKV